MANSADLSPDDRKHLSAQLVKLGDMMGDGLHYESDGKWIPAEYRRVAKALGHKMPSKPRANNSVAINERMQQRVKEQPCIECGSELKQTRSGSTKAACTQCGMRFTLLVVRKGKKSD